MEERRRFLRVSAVAGAGLVLAACGKESEGDKKISTIEASLGLADISQFTAPPPPDMALPTPSANK